MLPDESESKVKTIILSLASSWCFFCGSIFSASLFFYIKCSTAKYKNAKPVYQQYEKKSFFCRFTNIPWKRCLSASLPKPPSFYVSTLFKLFTKYIFLIAELLTWPQNNQPFWHEYMCSTPFRWSKRPLDRGSRLSDLPHLTLDLRPWLRACPDRRNHFISGGLEPHTYSHFHTFYFCWEIVEVIIVETCNIYSSL